MNTHRLAAGLLLLFTLGPAGAQIELPNKVDVVMVPNVSYDSETGLFNYRYTVTSTANSLQNVSRLEILLRGSILNAKAPTGWTARVNHDGTMLSLCACDPAGIVTPPGWVDDGNVVPSIYEIKPGQTLTGFSFQSLDPPAPGVFRAEGFVRLPTEGVDFPEGQEPLGLPTYPDNLFKGQTETPLMSDTVNPGGRRPAVDTFAQFQTLANGDIKQAPVLIDVVLGATGETVDRSSFRAMLNNVDITDQFVSIDANRRRAYLRHTPTQSPLKVGRNVLVTSVQGVVPGSLRTASDVDRVVFTVQP